MSRKQMFALGGVIIVSMIVALLAYDYIQKKKQEKALAADTTVAAE